MTGSGRTGRKATYRQQAAHTGAQRATASIRPEPLSLTSPRGHGSPGWGEAPLGCVPQILAGRCPPRVASLRVAPDPRPPPHPARRSPPPPQPAAASRRRRIPPRTVSTVRPAGPARPARRRSGHRALPRRCDIVVARATTMSHRRGSAGAGGGPGRGSAGPAEPRCPHLPHDLQDAHQSRSSGFRSLSHRRRRARRRPVTGARETGWRSAIRRGAGSAMAPPARAGPAGCGLPAGTLR